MSNPGFVSRMRKAVEHVEAARDLMARGPLDYYLSKLVHHSEVLLTRFAPLGIGQEARICKEVNTNNGWHSSRKHLSVGTVGLITDVDFRDDRFWFEFVPHEQWYEFNGEWKPKDRKHSYCLDEDHLELMP